VFSTKSCFRTGDGYRETLLATMRFRWQRRFRPLSIHRRHCRQPLRRTHVRFIKVTKVFSVSSFRQCRRIGLKKNTTHWLVRHCCGNPIHTHSDRVRIGTSKTTRRRIRCSMSRTKKQTDKQTNKQNTEYVRSAFRVFNRNYRCNVAHVERLAAERWRQCLSGPRTRFDSGTDRE